MNPLNDVSTMNKTMEYMAFGLPVVAFDLTRDPGLGRRRRGLRRAERRRRATRGRSSSSLDDAARGGAHGQARPRPGRGRARLAVPAPTYLQVFDDLVGRVSVPQPRVVALPDTEAAGTAASAAEPAERAPDVQPSVVGLDD